MEYSGPVKQTTNASLPPPIKEVQTGTLRGRSATTLKNTGNSNPTLPPQTLENIRPFSYSQNPSVKTATPPSSKTEITPDFRKRSATISNLNPGKSGASDSNLKKPVVKASGEAAKIVRGLSKKLIDEKIPTKQVEILNQISEVVNDKQASPKGVKGTLKRAFGRGSLVDLQKIQMQAIKEFSQKMTHCTLDQKSAALREANPQMAVLYLASLSEEEFQKHISHFYAHAFKGKLHQMALFFHEMGIKDLLKEAISVIPLTNDFFEDLCKFDETSLEIARDGLLKRSPEKPLEAFMVFCKALKDPLEMGSFLLCSAYFSLFSLECFRNDWKAIPTKIAYGILLGRTPSEVSGEIARNPKIFPDVQLFSYLKFLLTYQGTEVFNFLFLSLPIELQKKIAASNTSNQFNSDEAIQERLKKKGEITDWANIFTQKIQESEDLGEQMQILKRFQEVLRIKNEIPVTGIGNKVKGILRIQSLAVAQKAYNLQERMAILALKSYPIQERMDILKGCDERFKASYVEFLFDQERPKHLSEMIQSFNTSLLKKSDQKEQIAFAVSLLKLFPIEELKSHWMEMSDSLRLPVLDAYALDTIVNETNRDSKSIPKDIVHKYITHYYDIHKPEPLQFMKILQRFPLSIRTSYSEKEADLK